MNKLLVSVGCLAVLMNTANAEKCVDFDDNFNVVEYECGSNKIDANKTTSVESVSNKYSKLKMYIGGHIGYNNGKVKIKYSYSDYSDDESDSETLTLKDSMSFGYGVSLGVANPLTKLVDVRGELEYSRVVGLNYEYPDEYGAYEISLSYDIFLANMYFDLKTNPWFVPYIGGGVGYEIVNDEEKSGNIAWQIGVGVSHAVNDRLIVDLGGRFVSMTDKEEYSDSWHNEKMKCTFDNIQVNLGLRYTF